MNTLTSNPTHKMIEADFERLPYNIYFKFHHLKCCLSFEEYSYADKLESLLPPYHTLSDAGKCKLNFNLRTSGSEETKGFYLNGERIMQFEKIDETIFEAIESKIQMAMAVAMPPKMFLLHAGAVAFEKFGIIIPGKSFAGKTTLTREFLKKGARYYSDDCAVIDEKGNLYAYSKTLSIRNSLQQGEIYKAEDVGAVPGYYPVPVKMIIFAEYKKRHKLQLSPIGAGEAVLKLAKNLFYPASMTLYPSETLQVLAKLTNDSIILDGKRGDAREVVETLLKEFVFS